MDDYKSWLLAFLTSLFFFVIFGFVTGVHAAETKEVTVKAEWNASATATGYKLYYKFEGEADWRGPIDIPGGYVLTVEFKIARANEDVNFYVAMTAYNQYGESPESPTFGPCVIEGLHESPIHPEIGIITLTYLDGTTVVINFKDSTITKTMPDGTVTTTDF